MILSYQQILEEINRSLDRIDYPKHPKGLYEPIKYTLSLGGKRIRPVLMLLAAQMFGADLKRLMPAALGIETYHNHTLLHDDLMDCAPVRRGMMTVHQKWDNNTAILSGDAMLILACQQILSCEAENKQAAMELFVRTALEICEGQQYDMNFETRTDVTESEYVEMIRLKTSVLLGCALKMGALLAGAPKLLASELYEFGEQIGLAFQLQDDLLDVYGSTKVFGKRIGGDIVCNKKTFLLINAYLRANKEQRQELDFWTGLKEFDEQEKIKAITSIYNQLGVKQLTEIAIERYFGRAKTVIDNIALEKEKTAPLWDFAIQLMNRSN